MKGLTVHASDGEIGSVDEFYFDDKTWAVRYLVVKTGGWLSGRKVLISPVFLQGADWATGQFNASLTRKQIEESPDIDTQRPVSRQHEAAYLDYFSIPYYWGGPYVWGAGLFPGDMVGMVVPTLTRSAPVQELSGDSHLRSTDAVTGYDIEASDGEVGHVEDFIVDQDTWIIRYVEVNTGNWLPGKKFLISPEWISEVSQDKSSVAVDLRRETIQGSPEYAEAKTVDREYEGRLHAYYDRKGYWLR